MEISAGKDDVQLGGLAPPFMLILNISCFIYQWILDRCYCTKLGCVVWEMGMLLWCCETLHI